jgi:hypothetical protein
MQDSFQAGRQAGWDPAFVDGAGCFFLDGAPAAVDVFDVAGVEFDDEHAAVAVADQQSFLGEALHRLAHGAAAHFEAGGQLHLADLFSGREATVEDPFPQLVGDHGRGSPERGGNHVVDSGHQPMLPSLDVPTSG